MAAITAIRANIRTGNSNNAGTNGFVYLGICGREFQLSSTGDDFEQNSNRDYVLGSGANVEQATFNDPRDPQLDTTDADQYPVYIRFEPQGSSPDWDLERALVTISPGGAQYSRLGGAAHLWLGQLMGKVCYLRRV